MRRLARLAAPARRPGLLGATYAQWPSGDAGLLEDLEHLSRHALWQVDQAVVVADVDSADEAAFEVGLVGDHADDVARLHAVDVTDFDAEGFHADFGSRVAARPLRF